MNNSSDTRSAIAEALQDKLFVEFAAKQTGAFLRNAVARHLSERRVNVVVVAASGIGNQTPYVGAEIVWQPRLGGGFERQLVNWADGDSTVLYEEISGTTHIMADCPNCRERNDLVVDNGVVLNDLLCSHCGCRLIA